MMSTKKLTGKGEQMKEKMVAITARILREKGFKAATVRTIAKEANVNIAAVRYYFGSKEELIGAALEYMMSALENVVSVLDDSRLSPTERMKSTSSDTLPSPISTPPSSAPSPAHPALTRGRPISFI